MSSARLALAFVLAVLGAACVRLDPPEAFTCVTSADCPSDQRCSSGGLCIADGDCVRSVDCPAMQRCDTLNLRCVAAECHDWNIGVCGRYACDDGVCKRECLSEQDCVLDSVCTLPTPTYGSTRLQCLPRPKSYGEACLAASECDRFLKCCGAVKTCGDCYSGGTPCDADDDCESGRCCDGTFGKTCSYAGQCPPPIF